MNKRIKVQVTYMTAHGVVGYAQAVPFDVSREEGEEAFRRYCTKIIHSGITLYKKDMSIDAMIMPGAVLEVRFAGIV